MKTRTQIIFGILWVVNFINAQTTLKGKVLNLKNKPVTGAVIYLDSVASNTQTNKEGEFEVVLTKVPKRVQVQSKKYGWLSSIYTGENYMNFIFLETTKPAVENPKNWEVGKDKNTVIYRTIYDMIRGRIAGVVVQPDNTIIIRGINSIKYNAEPLFVVDGNVVSSIDFIVPAEVKSITVLKDAEASIYGARGANGVIIITLKK